MPYVLIGNKQVDSWPPDDPETTKRLANYSRTRQLFKGQHADVYERVQRWLEKEADKGITYIVANFPGLISKVSADMLFGEKVKYIAGESGSKEQELLNAIVKTNNLQSLNYEVALSTSWRGEAVYKVRYGNLAGWKDDKMAAIIEAVSPGLFWPIQEADNVRGVRGGVFAWVKTGANDKKYLRLERQLPGIIENELWLLEEDGRTIKEQVKLKTFPEYENLEDRQETGYPGLLFKFVPNFRLEDQFWGISDYFDMESIFDEMNNRLSRISRVLDKHESPKLILPPGIMEFDEQTQRWYVKKEDLEAIEIDRQDESVGGDLPKYLTWDAELEAAFKQIDKLLELAFMISETSPDAFGMGVRGAAESGRALKFRLLRLLAKINRKKMYFDEALKYVLGAAMHLEHTKGNADIPDPAELDLRLEWADGIPDDPVEAAETEQIRTGNKQTTSIKSAVRRLDDLEGEDLDNELDAIRDDQAGEGTVPPPAGVGARRGLDLGAGGE